MRIVYLIEDFSIKGGAEHIIAEKANCLAAEGGHDVTIVSIFTDERPAAYPLHGVKLVRLDVPFASAGGNILAKTLSRIRVLTLATARFNKLTARLRPDIIFFTLPLGGLMLPLYRGRAKKVYESHSARSFTPYHTLFTPMELAADAIVCLTEDDARQYRHARRTEVIPNFINTPASYVADYGARRAIAVGRLEHAKGFDRLVNCWKDAIEANPGWQLDIYGEGSCRRQLERQIKELRLENSVFLRGNVDNIYDIYPRYSLNAASSRYEGLNMAMLEAQACGLPSVTFNFKYGASDIIRDGYNGLIVPQDNTEAYTLALSRMMADDAMRASCGANARLSAKRFASKEVMEKWHRFISSLHA